MKVVALAGGVGGAKLVDGLARILPPSDLTVIVNTGDDFTHLGLRICPDLDTICYTLAGLVNPATGWGRQDETWNALRNLQQLGGPGWFNLGDQDLGTHLERTRRLQAGQRLTEVTADFCRAWGVKHPVLPMCDDPVETQVETEEYGWLAFQEYFVRYGFAPRVKRFHFQGSEAARISPEVAEALRRADCIVVCPSNPWVSIGPMLSIPGMQALFEECPVSVGVSPIVGDQAIKGPAAKMYAELGFQPSPLAVARQYASWVKAFVFDIQDKEQEGAIRSLGLEAKYTDTIMSTTQKRVALAEFVLDFCTSLGASA